jgi:hypothetical protein
MIFLILSFRNLFVATNETVHYTRHLIRPKMLESVCAKFFLSPHPFCYSPFKSYYSCTCCQNPHQIPEVLCCLCHSLS